MKDGLSSIDGNVVRIGHKEHGAYMFACTMSLNERGKVTLVSRGKYNCKSIDILENLKRQSPNPLKVGFATTTEFDGKRRVSTLKIDIRRTE